MRRLPEAGAGMTTVEVRTAAGRVRGRWENGVAVFRGIPFAAPPVGPNRFTAPAPVPPWDGVRDASRFGPPPPQPGRSTVGDDWLNLTVWTPDPGRAGLPVVVWISGGGYLACDSADPHLAGDTLAAGGAVVVSVHYRSGAEGFLRLDGAPDNRALLDQLAALNWVRADIAAFGGDPDNVTVFGQSAGAGSIAALLTMPSAAGAVRRAILQSIPGTYFTLGLADDVALEVCAELGRTPRTDDLADVAPDDLVVAVQAVTDRLPRRADRWGAVAWSSTPFSPVVDGDVLPTAPWAALAGGAARDVDLLVGHTRDEYSLLAAELPDVADADADALIDGLHPTPGAGRYRHAFPGLSGNALRETVLADWLYRMPALHLAEAVGPGRRAGVALRARVGVRSARRVARPRHPARVRHRRRPRRGHRSRPRRRRRGPPAVGRAPRRPPRLRRRRQPRLAPLPTARAPHPHLRPEPHLAAYPEERSRAIWRGQRFGVLGLRG